MEISAFIEEWEREGALALPGGAARFDGLAWEPHAAFDGVAMKTLVTGEATGGAASFHLVRVAPGKAIGEHIHARAMETHEVVCGHGTCVSGGAALRYAPGVVSVLAAGVPHEVRADETGLLLLAKFFPALV